MPPRERWVVGGTGVFVESAVWPWRPCGVAGMAPAWATLFSRDPAAASTMMPGGSPAAAECIAGITSAACRAAAIPAAGAP